MFDISKRLLYYKRKEICQAIVGAAKDREVGTRIGNRGFGKRPDALFYPNDVLDAVKRGTTSFHLSEEIWRDPLQISTELKKQELESLRTGWDLVLDIDCPYWFFSKLTTHLFIKSLKMHNIDSVTCKFSGNKGFHIGVPFKAFPREVNGVETRSLFPEGPKRIALYLLDYISNNLVEIDKEGHIIFDKRYRTTMSKISKMTGKSLEELSVKVCRSCKSKIRKDISTQVEFICPSCSYREKRDDESKVLVCPKCNTLIKPIIQDTVYCKCGSKEEPKEIFEPLSIVDVDTILISSRHLYRSPYSMHEKSELVSIPIETDDVMKFEKVQAEPEKVKIGSLVFLDDAKTRPGEAATLIVQAFDYKIATEKKTSSSKKTFELPDQAVPEEYFPPSIQKGLEGMKDGKKRFLFILLNFLASLGWPYAKMEELVYKWNKKNPEPLRDNYVVSQLKYYKDGKKVAPPPNYDTGIYRDLGLEEEESVSRRYRNPLVYSMRLFEQNKKKTRKRLTDEQKEMRRKFRESKKKRDKEN